MLTTPFTVLKPSLTVREYKGGVSLSAVYPIHKVVAPLKKIQLNCTFKFA